jgi:hypothetical protein
MRVLLKVFQNSELPPHLGVVEDRGIIITLNAAEAAAWNAENAVVDMRVV